MAPSDIKVSFVVPCYKLGHLLRECVASILSQTYKNFEVLIMDDCSPDNTPEVARSFDDPRVQHVRNEPNLGHLANYNKGIRMARGEYIWLISADDKLRSPQVLERYVGMMDRFPNVGYVFCPTMKLSGQLEAGVMPYSLISDKEKIFNGRRFLAEHLVIANIVPAPAAMARKECYEQVSYFPHDLPHAGDWYLWGMFALHCDVGYFPEPMVSRRFHEDNMSSGYYKEAVLKAFANNLAVLLRIKEQAAKNGFTDIVGACNRGIVAEYVRQVTPAKAGDPIQIALSDEEFENSLADHIQNPEERKQVRASVYGLLGDYYFEQKDLERSEKYYQRAVREDFSRAGVLAKYLLSRMGATGSLLRESVSRMKRQFRRV
jgi:glycosyltransferase involved in cell wall biosynthesis